MRNNWMMQSGVFDKATCQSLKDQMLKLAPQKATTFADQGEDYRVSTVRWVNDKSLSDYIYSHVLNCNLHAFNADIQNYCEMQFTEYNASEGGQYRWHHDVDFTSEKLSDRKLSVVIQLTDPSEYEGGDLMFNEVQNPENADLRKQGTMIVFPSYLQHCVTQVTKGTRHSLVLWFFGPRWR